MCPHTAIIFFRPLQVRSTCSSGSRFYANLVINNALASRPGPEVITAKKPEVLIMCIPYALCLMPDALCPMSQRYQALRS